MIIGYLLSILLGAASFLSPQFLQKFEHHKNKFASFTIGLATVYVFLQLLPEAYQGIDIFGLGIFLTTLIGFSVFHIAEKSIVKYEKKPKLRRDLSYLHLSVFFFYHTMVGIALIELLKIQQLSGFLFAISLSFVYLTTSALFEDLHAKQERYLLLKRILSAATFLFGAIIAEVLHVSNAFLYPALGFVSGVLIYIIGKEVLPQYKASNPFYFTLGVIVYAAFILLLNSFGLI
ncbi:hypothetical protein HYX14_02650 [Candidatus Woesearchaeota archaeon]|nr:hypothetical protein [Candidatus Woesearchaeota archaeon]